MALRTLGNTMDNLGTSVQRLSTGLRINNASDDPAGLIISESMRTHILGIDQATRNAQDAINMTKTAEAAMDEVQRLLRSMRAIAVQSANTATIDATQLQTNQAQLRNTIQSVDRIATQTQWGDKRLLDGTAGAISNLTRPNDVSSVFIGGTFKGESVSSGPITAVVTTAAERATVSLGATFTDGNAIVAGTGSFVINGYSFSSDGTQSVQTLVSKINSMSQSTGVVAQITGSGPVSISLHTTEFGASKRIDFFDPNQIVHNADSATDTGVNAVVDVSVATVQGVMTETFTGGQGSGVSGLLTTDRYGNAIQLTEQGNSALTSAAQVGVMTAGGVQFHVGAMSDQSVSFSMPNVFANRLGTGIVAGQDVSTIDVTTTQGAQDAIKIIDQAVIQLAQWRGDIGAFQSNFLDSTVRSLGVAKENLTASESSIRDIDMAEEMTNYTRLQILNQSGMAMLAQANQLPKGVLSLLQNA